MERETDRQTDTQTQTHRHRQTDRQTDRQIAVSDATLILKEESLGRSRLSSVTICPC